VTARRHIPAAVKRAVWVRDLGRCAFVGADGHRCGGRAFVEFHHVRPYALGGRPTVDNIELRCRRHDGFEARLYFARDPLEEELPDAEGGRDHTDGRLRRSVSLAADRGELVPERKMRDMRHVSSSMRLHPH
jgi:hypothetical protein